MKASARAALTGEDFAKVYLGVHQRLDRDTSGVIVFARSARRRTRSSRF
ncbi:MAG: hypothetical protein R3A52_11695 [Polyangiales bacterium]